MRARHEVVAMSVSTTEVVTIPAGETAGIVNLFVGTRFIAEL